MECENCPYNQKDGKRQCTRTTINRIDGYCWMEKYVKACKESLPYITHDCLCCDWYNQCKVLE